MPGKQEYSMGKQGKESKYARFADMWYQIDSASFRYFYPRLAEIGLTRGQPKMLRFLGTHDGCRQKDIAEQFCLRAASVSAILDVMEKDGMIERRPNPESRRETLIFLTEAGRQKLGQLAEFYQELDREVFHGMEDSEYEHMMSTLEKIHQVLTEKIQ